MSVQLAGVESSLIVNETDSVVVVVAAAGVPVTGNVVVTSSTGAFITKVGAWRYVRSVIESLEPSSGQEGTVVRLHGVLNCLEARVVLQM